MINSVSSSASVTAQYMHDQKPPVHAAKAKKAAEPQDTVVLSEKAKAAADRDSDGD